MVRNALARILGDSVVLVSRIPPKCVPRFALSGLHTDVWQLFYTSARFGKRFLRGSNFKRIVNYDFIDFSYIFFCVCKAAGVYRLALLSSQLEESLVSVSTSFPLSTLVERDGIVCVSALS